MLNRRERKHGKVELDSCERVRNSWKRKNKNQKKGIQVHNERKLYWKYETSIEHRALSIIYSNVCNLFVCFNDDDYDNDCISCIWLFE